MKKALFWVLILSIFWGMSLFFLKSYWLSGKTFNILLLPLLIGYMWIPGTIALIFSRKEKIKLPIFKKPNKYFWYACFVPLAITLLDFLHYQIFQRHESE
jgi:uncharacterized protein